MIGLVAAFEDIGFWGIWQGRDVASSRISSKKPI